MGDNRGIAPLNLTGNVAENWKLWRLRFENYMLATELNKKDQATQCAQVLHYIGEEAFKIYTTFELLEEEKNKIAILLKKFETHFLPRENLSYERYQFFSYRQSPEQSFEQFVTELKKKAMKCKLGNLQDSLTKAMVICGVSNSVMRQRLLEDDSLSLDDAIQLCKVIEATAIRTSAMESSSSSFQGDVDSIKIINSCKKCTRTHPINKCPAFGKVCSFCNIKNHFADACYKKKKSCSSNNNFNRSKDYRYNKNTSRNTQSKYRNKQINEIENCNESHLFIGSVEEHDVEHNQWHTIVKINNKYLKFKLDSGAMANVLPLSTFLNLGFHKSNIKSTGSKLKAYTGDDLKVLGTYKINCFKNRWYKLEFYIVDSETQCILGLDSCIKLNLIKKVDNVSHINSEYSNIVNSFQDTFEGIGCLDRPYHIELLDGAKPVVQPIRRVPLPLVPKLKEALDSLVQQKIIEKVDGSSDWVHGLVIVKKPDSSLRICMDMKVLNNCIKREYCQIPTIEEVSGELAGAEYFSCLDASNGFYQIMLDKESADICTVGTPFGLYKFVRLPFGMKSAPEVFQKRFRQIFNVPGTKIYIDDLLIWGKTKAEHDERLKKVLKIAKQNNIKFNKSKCKFGVSKIKYMGHIFSKNGVEPDLSKVVAIQKFSKPVCKQDVQRLLGMLTYLSKFIPNFSAETSCLRDLLKKDVEFCWENPHELAFNKIKEILMSRPVLQMFDVNKQSTISVDSSKSGMGAVLLQDNLPCAYASKALTECQTRYAQIEKELLAICFGLDRFYQFIFGKKVIVETDHQPLLAIFKKPLNKTPARLQRMLMQIQKYDIVLRYRRGSQLYIADALSRAYIKEQIIDNFDKELQAQVCLIISQINVTENKLKEFQINTNKDCELIELKKVILEGWPNNNKKVNDKIKAYSKFKDELTVLNNVIFRGQAIVVPSNMRREMLNRIHYSHMGINKCTKLAQESLFWPNMKNEIKQLIENCLLCNKYANSQKSEPLEPHFIPKIPWNKVGCDLFELRGVKYLLIIDYYSKYIEIEELSRDTTSHSVINFMKAIFARHGIPLTVVSDGGPQFTSEMFKRFSREWEFEHIVTSPYHSAANGMAERHVQTAKQLFRKVTEDNRDLFKALLQYRNMPVVDNISPAQILMSRHLRSMLPLGESSLKPRVVDVDRFNNLSLKSQDTQQKYFNKKGVQKLKPLVVGDNVFVQLKPNTTWTPAVIVKRIRDRSYSVKVGNNTYVRNRKFIKLCKNAKASVNKAKVQRSGNVIPDAPKVFIEITNHGNDPDSENVAVDADPLEGEEEVCSANSVVDVSNAHGNFDRSSDESDYNSLKSSPESEIITIRNKSSYSGRTIKKPDRLNL